MGIFNSIGKNRFGKSQQDQQESQSHQAVQEALSIDPNLRDMRDPNFTTKEQAKDKINTTAYTKSTSTGTTALDITNLPYVLPKRAVDNYTAYYGNDTKNIQDFKIFNNNIKLPQRLVGGGEDEPLITENIDFKKMYNGEAKSLMNAYYADKQNIRDMKKFLYATAGVYAYGNIVDMDELKKKLNEVDFGKMNDEEVRFKVA